MIGTGARNCLLLKKQVEHDLGCKLNDGRPEALEFSEPEHKLTCPSEKPFGDLPIDSGFIAHRQFSNNEFVNNSETWLRGRVEKKGNSVVLLVKNRSVDLTSGNKALIHYRDGLRADSVVDTFGKLTREKSAWKFCMSRLYGISESSGEDRSHQGGRVQKFQLRSDVLKCVRDVISMQGFVEVASMTEACEALHLDMSQIYWVDQGRSINCVMEIEDNYVEVVAFVSFLMEHLFEAFPSLSGKGGVPILTFRECAELMSMDSEASNAEETLDLSQLADNVKAEFGSDCFVMDKLSRRGDAMPDPYNSKVSNRFTGYCRGQQVLSGQQNVHDATRIHQRTQLHTHHGTMPNGEFSLDMIALTQALS